MPRVNTATRPMHSTVITAIQLSNGEAETLLAAIGARLRPIAITTAPVTTGGIIRSIQRVPIFITTRPIRVYTRPQAMMPPRATLRLGLIPWPLNPVVAMTTPTKAALEPR